MVLGVVFRGCRLPRRPMTCTGTDEIVPFSMQRRGDWSRCEIHFPNWRAFQEGREKQAVFRSILRAERDGWLRGCVLMARSALRLRCVRGPPFSLPACADPPAGLRRAVREHRRGSSPSSRTSGHACTGAADAEYDVRLADDPKRFESRPREERSTTDRTKQGVVEDSICSRLELWESLM